MSVSVPVTEPLTISVPDTVPKSLGTTAPTTMFETVRLTAVNVAALPKSFVTVHETCLVPSLRQTEDPVTSLECADTMVAGKALVTIEATINAMPKT